jgi:Immunity protein 50
MCGHPEGWPFSFQRSTAIGDQMLSEEYQKLESVYLRLPGGPELLAWFGRVPSFHDAEIVSLTLNRRSPSFLTIHGWTTDGSVTQDGYLVLQKKAVVTFEIQDIVYLNLEGFSGQNVIDGILIAQRPPDHLAKSYYDFASDGDDFEIVLEPCYGMDGVIRCKNISISFVPGDPADSRKEG